MKRGSVESPLQVQRAVWVAGCCRLEPNLDEVAGTAVDVDVVQLQADHLAGLGDDKCGTGQLGLGGHEGEVAVGGQHVQTSWATNKNMTMTMVMRITPYKLL